MKKFAGTLFAVLGFTIKLTVLLSVIIVGLDLVNRYIEDHSPNAIDTEEIQ